MSPDVSLRQPSGRDSSPQPEVRAPQPNWAYQMLDFCRSFGRYAASELTLNLNTAAATAAAAKLATR